VLVEGSVTTFTNTGGSPAAIRPAVRDRRRSWVLRVDPDQTVSLTAPEHVTADLEDYEILAWSPAMAPIALDPSSVEALLWGDGEAA